MKRIALVLALVLLSVSLIGATPALASSAKGGVTAVKKVAGGYRFKLKSGSVSRYFYSYSPKKKFIRSIEADAISGYVYRHRHVSPATMASAVRYELRLGRRLNATFYYHKNSRGRRVLNKRTSYIEWAE